ncbi:MAG: sigma-54 dependent transcriptional regulator [Ignavibacteria bacterium]|nr:sigma-54 dependent transcriptional regulator [Ignavibacteria bacterium]
MGRRILIVDDERSILESLSLILSHNKYEVDTCIDGFSALEKVNSTEYDLILLDIKMPRMDGLEVLEKIIEIRPNQVVIMISGHGNVETAVEATKKGAYYFLEKPLPDIPELILTIRNAIEFKNSKDEILRLMNKQFEENIIIGQSSGIMNVLELIEKFKDLQFNVLITGESGTGKMLVANQLHFNSNRKDKPFVIINCAILNDATADNELFGFVEGNIIKNKGKLAEAEGGTILFDEVSNLGPDVQSKLLKVIDEGKFSRTGQINDVKTDLRFLFASNKDLKNEIEEGRFREDFYHRINVMQIHVPPLRERIEDIEILADYFIDQVCKVYTVTHKTFTEEAILRLQSFRWPGNVRELKNFTERLMFTIDGEMITEDDIELPGNRHSKELNDLLNKDLSLNDFQNESEKMFLMKMLGDYKYNISQTAEALKIQRSHLYKLMSKYEIPTPSKIK